MQHRRAHDLPGLRCRVPAGSRAHGGNRGIQEMLAELGRGGGRS